MEEWRVSVAPKVSPSVNPFKYAFGIFDAVSPKAKLSLHTPTISRFCSVRQDAVSQNETLSSGRVLNFTFHDGHGSIQRSRVP